MTARADRCRRVTYMGVFVGQGPGAHGSIVHGQYPFKGGSTVLASSCKTFLQSRHRSQGWYHTQQKHCPSPPRAPWRRLVAFLLGQDREGKPLRNPAPGFGGSWVWLTVSVVRYGFTARCETDASGYMEPDVPIATSAVHTSLGFIRS